MRNKIILLLVIFMFCLCACTPNERARSFGGTDKIDLEEGQKLEEITWKEDTYWILTRDRREDEVAETHTFYAKSPYGIIEGKVIITEH